MFEESLKSKESVKTYVYLVKKFIKFHNLKDFDSIVKIAKPELQKLVETYIIDLKHTINPNTIPTYLNPIKTFLEMNDIDLNWRKIKKLYPQMIKASGSSAYTTEDIQKMLTSTTVLKNRALIHFIASSGVRIGSIPEMKLEHIRDMPLGCKMITVYADSIEEYQTFLTPESSKALDDYLEERQKHGEKLNDESPLFREKYLLGITEPKHITTGSLQAILKRAIKKTTVRGQKKDGRYKEQLAHGFRKRFNTILKLNNSVNDNAIEKMLGHKRGLDGVYLQITVDELFNEFSKGILDLTIDKTEKQQAEIEKLESEKSELEKKNIENNDLRSIVEDLKSRVDILTASKETKSRN